MSFALILSHFILTTLLAGGNVPADPTVVVNGVELDHATLSRVETRLGQRVPVGRYWYDSACGAWGLEGGPALGVTLAGLNLGGPLRPDASGGDRRGRQTWVWVNGRELHAVDVMQLTQLVGPVQPGRYWLDAAGNAGLEGGPALVNLWQVIRGSTGGSAYHRRTAGGYIGGDGSTSYFFDPETGSSVMID